MLTPVEYQVAILEVGPSPTLISQHLGIPLSQVNRDLRDSDIKRVFEERVDAILAVMKRFGANRTLLAQAFEVDRYQVEAWLSEVPKLQRAFIDFQEGLVDIAEMNLLYALQQRERWATEFTLNSYNRASKRGWGQHLTIDLDAELARAGMTKELVVAQVARQLAESQSSENPEQ